MIEINDPRRPANLAFSSVLKMVEEEDEKMHPATNGRKSRSRQREINRETVLKINRRRPRRNISWPPSEDRSRSRSSSEEIHFDDTIRKRHEIFHLKEMFDQGAIDENKRNNSRPSSKDRMQSNSPVANSKNENATQFNDTESAKRQQEWPPTPNNDSNDQLANKSFHLPENELHIGKIEPIRKYFNTISSASSSKPLEYGERFTGVKRWKSHENITLVNNSASTGCYSQLVSENPHKKDNLPLERYKSNSYNELPPLKPRREYHKNVHSTKKKLNLNNSEIAAQPELMGAKKSDESLKIDTLNQEGSQSLNKKIQLQVNNTDPVPPKLQRHEPKNKFASTQVTLIPPTFNRNTSDNKVCIAPKYWGDAVQRANQFHDNNITSSSLPHNWKHNKQVRYESSKGINKPENDAKNSCSHIMSATTNDNAKSQHAVHENIDVNQNDNIKRNDAMKTSQRSANKPELLHETMIDTVTEKSQKYYQPNDTNLVQQRVGRDENLVVTRGKQEIVTETASGRSIANEEKCDQGANSSIRHNPTLSMLDNKNNRRRGMCYTDGEYIWEPCDSSLDIAATFQNETESLNLKRELVESAITQDLLRIKDYMKRAEEEVHKAEKYLNECNISTPLQAIIKEMFNKTISHPPHGTDVINFDPMALKNENTPVVDQALIDLYKISKALESMHSTPDSARITANTTDSHDETSPSTISPYSLNESSESGAAVDKIIQSKNILSGYLITKQQQEELFHNIHSPNLIHNPAESGNSNVTLDLTNGKTTSIDNYNGPSQSDATKSTLDELKDHIEVTVIPRLTRGHHVDSVNPNDDTTTEDDKLIENPIKEVLNSCQNRIHDKSKPHHRQENHNFPPPSGEKPAKYSPLLAIKSDGEVKTVIMDYGSVHSGDGTSGIQSNCSHYQQQGDELQNDEKLSNISSSMLSNYPTGECNNVDIPDDNESLANFSTYMYGHHRSICRDRAIKENDRIRSISHESNLQRHHQHYLPRQHSFDSSESRYYASPSLYATGHYKPTEGYKRVAWPPADSISPQSGAHNQQPSYQGYQQPEAQQQQQQQPQYRDQSPGVITLRKSAPISQKPAPVFTSQPAAAKYMGGANMRGDLKWPPQEYKDQAAAENEARRKLALGPAFRPRRVHKDYTQFFAKNALNSYYPGYKVPPGTQHVEANY